MTFLLLIICVTLVTLSMSFSPAAFQSHFTYGNETDRLALLEFKRKIISATYVGALDSWNGSSDYCGWEGIECNHEHPRRVTVLDLVNWEIDWKVDGLSIPPDIGNLTFLTTLRLGYNSFHGEIPQEIGRLFRLQFLDLSHNRLHGEIPSSLKNCLDLKVFYLNGNMFEGKVPPSLHSLSGIQELVLSSNQLSGPIPEYLHSFHSIKRLDLSNNQLSGGIPQDISCLFQLQYLDLSDNQLSGEIPREIGRLVQVQYLDMSNNQLSGELPPSLQSLKAIQELILSSNQLSGPIPEYLKSFHSLEKLDLSYNDFEGEVPKEGIFNNTSVFSCRGNDKLCRGFSFPDLRCCDLIAEKHFQLMRLLLILSGFIISVILLGSLIIFRSRRKAARNKLLSSSESSFTDMLQKVPYKPSSPESPFSDLFHQVSYKDLLTATDGFSAKNLVGVGGYGSVYIGILMLSQEITSIVAVKVLDLQRRGALKSFRAECEALRCIRHRNVMKILTSCSSVDFGGNEFKALVYEYMPNGSLENWLHPTANNGQHQRSTNRPLKFIERLNIATDVASALDYLHRQCQTPIAHCDLKPSNVLLDEDMNGHLGDFGSAKFLRGAAANVESGNHCCSTSLFRGSIGYVAPEYGMGRAISTNGDFYSFGILLLELFTGRRPTADMFKDGLSLHSFAKTALFSNGVMQIADPTLVILQNDDGRAKICQALTDIIKLGVTCSIESPKDRTEMVLVVKVLESIKNMYLS